MNEYFFAGYRLVTEERIAEREETSFLSAFAAPMPYSHTFTLRLGDPARLQEMYLRASAAPSVCSTERFTVRDTGDTWSLISVPGGNIERYTGKIAAVCSRDYGDITVYISDEPRYSPASGRRIEPRVPFSSYVRAVCEVGMVLRDGLPLHASLVEKDGGGVLFLGPSGRGKSTQAWLWAQYRGAEIIIGDRPALRCIDGVWYGFGMPWDGKDGIRKQKRVPVRALIALEQAKANSIRRLSVQEAGLVLMNQAMLPLWDEKATESAMALMGRLARDVPFYRLKNLPDEEATALTYRAVFEKELENEDDLSK